MNAVANALLVRETLISQVALKRTRPTMTWHIDNANGRPVIGWVRLPTRSSIVIDER
jgi:hypothetical protein